MITERAHDLITPARAVLFDLFHTLTSLEGTGAPPSKANRD